MPEKIFSPKVSIIIPTWNRAGLIMETIESIREQTYTNWELIIIDDGSDDNTEMIIEKLNDERIHFIRAGRISIGGRIKNIGLEKATGDLIAFNDSDDLWAESKLEKQVNALQQYPDAGFCLTGGYNFRKFGEPLDYFYKQNDGVRYDDILISIFKSEVAVFAQALMFRKNCLSATGLFKEEKSFSDFDFIVSLARHFKAVILYESLVFRRLHDANYITPNWEKSYYEGAAIILDNKSYLPAKIYKDALFRLFTNFGEKCLYYKKRGKAIKNFLTAWGYKPLSFVPYRKTAKAILSFFTK